MKILVKMSVLVYGTIVVLLSSLLVVVSNSALNRVEVIRHAGSPPSADAFSNPGCLSKDCVGGTHCYDGGCCQCQCPNNKANYIVNKNICFSRDQLNAMNSTKCKYSIRKPNEPLLGLPLTEQMVQQVAFTRTADHETLIPCNQSVQVSWKYRDAFGDWKDGPGNIFSVGVFIKNRQIRDQRVIKNLTWTGKLNSNYAGMLIKFLFKCEGNVQGCALAKISGGHEYDKTARPPPVITTTAAATTKKLPDTTTTTTSTESYENSTNAYQRNNEQQASGKGDASAVFGPILGVLGLICLIGVVCVVAAKYRRMKRRQENEVEKLEEYQDPIYADINKGDFDNPIYCDPTLDPAYIQAQLGPLPKIPGAESPYEPLNSLTRNTPDYDNPVNGVKPDVDYDNPPVGGMNTTSDYDNPPVTGGMENTEDYDNPPVQDGKENTGHYDNPPVTGGMEDTDDYDNPPVQDGKENTGDYDNPPVTGGIENTEDYDNPPVQDGKENTSDYNNPPAKTGDDIPLTDNAESDTTDEDTFF